MRAILKLPRKRARSVWIPNKLEALQKAVGGYIETVPFMGMPSMCMIVNEEGRRKNLTTNIRTEYHTLVGPVLVVGVAGEEFRGLSCFERKLANYYLRKRDFWAD